MATVVWFILSAGLCGVVMAGCPPTKVVSSLDLNKLMGRWYEHASLGTLFLYGLDRCKVTTFSLDSDEHTITMLHSRIPYLRSSQAFTTWTATAKDSNPDGHLTLNLKLPIIGTIEAPLMVMDTDYDNYLVLYLCRNIGFFNFNAGYILTRKRSYSTGDLNKMYASIDTALMQNKLQRSNFVLSNNKNCPAETSQQTSSFSATDMSTLLEIKVPEETASTSSDGTKVQLESVGDESTMDKFDSSINKVEKEETASTSSEGTKVQSESVGDESTMDKSDSSINNVEKEETASTSSDGTKVQSESVGDESTMDETETDSSKNNEQKDSEEKKTATTSNDSNDVQLESVEKESTDGTKTDSSKDEELKEQAPSTSGEETADLSESGDETVGADATIEVTKSSDSTVPLRTEVAATQVESEDTTNAA